MFLHAFFEPPKVAAAKLMGYETVALFHEIHYGSSACEVCARMVEEGHVVVESEVDDLARAAADHLIGDEDTVAWTHVKKRPRNQFGAVWEETNYAGKLFVLARRVLASAPTAAAAAARAWTTTPAATVAAGSRCGRRSRTASTK